MKTNILTHHQHAINNLVKEYKNDERFKALIIVIAFVVAFALYAYGKDTAATQLVVPFFKDIMPQLGLMYIIWHVDDNGVATITLNRTAKHNAFDACTIDLLIHRLDYLALRTARSSQWRCDWSSKYWRYHHYRHP